MKSSLVVKHSVIINRRSTCVSLEDVFWTALKEIAQERGETLPRLISRIDADRQSANLSSVLRVFILEYYRYRLHDKMAVSLVPDAELISS
jgi:predicted DNA-binding ribbon-helix-helix protein